MRVRVSYCLAITLYDNDIEDINQGKHLEAQLDVHKNAKVFFYVVDDVDKIKQNLTRDPEEESGFHIEFEPIGVGPEGRNKYDVYLSRNEFDKLANPENMIKGGYFVSRSRADRIDIMYYPGVGKNNIL